jgi:hypothetical protein
MSEVIKNKTEGSEFLLIGKQKFDADREGIFRMYLDDVKNILVKELPIVRKCLILSGPSFEQLNSPVVISSLDEFDLIFERRSNDVVKVTFVEETELRSWPFQITEEFYYILKEVVLNRENSFNAQVIHNQVGRRGLVYFEFAIELEASTIGEVYDKAIKINKSVDDRIAHAIEKGINCIRFVIEGAFQIKLPPNVFPGIKKDNNSKV